MRYATIVLSWSDGRINSLDERFARSDAVSIASIRYLNPIREDRYVELVELRGDLDRARELLADCVEAIEYDVAGEDGHGVAYVQCRIVDPIDDLLSILREHEIVLDWPMTYVDTEQARGLEMTAFGTSRSIQRAAAALPDGIDLELRQLGEYEPGAEQFSPGLTDRQRDLFEFALSEGYYEVPRETTHRELAARLDLATATVSEHLQRIESKLAAAYASATR
ncbi:helix-turn-helix domain-containing protein [Natrinema salifodinae]|uniref:HTH DNA binding domain-containing protein n=1 Tax=Natrinema salifodinae TaxID=1202768 RepID=A0A1I0P7T6_9EURY|nr:helix-turn-helix domain-containing protein [Natrinema salifodinae]SEW09591.1 HTH DNA binding domain-containing protein [Natrinema salifodinae]